MRIKHFALLLLFGGFHQCKKANAEDIKTVSAEEVQTNLEVRGVKPEHKKSSKKSAILVYDQKFISDTKYRDSITNLPKELPVSIFSINDTVNPQSVSILSKAGFTSIYILQNGIRELKKQ